MQANKLLRSVWLVAWLAWGIGDAGADAPAARDASLGPPLLQPGANVRAADPAAEVAFAPGSLVMLAISVHLVSLCLLGPASFRTQHAWSLPPTVNGHAGQAAGSAAGAGSRMPSSTLNW